MPARRRTNFPRDVREQALERADGRCEAVDPTGERCPFPIPVGGRVFDHIHPDRAGGRATFDNCQVLCTPCHKAKFGPDIRLIAKVRRQEVAYVGLRCSRRPMDGGVSDNRTKGVDGILRDRDTGAVLTKPWIVDVRSL